MTNKIQPGEIVMARGYRTPAVLLDTIGDWRFLWGQWPIWSINEDRPYFIKIMKSNIPLRRADPATYDNSPTSRLMGAQRLLQNSGEWPCARPKYLFGDSVILESRKFKLLKKDYDTLQNAFIIKSIVYDYRGAQYFYTLSPIDDDMELTFSPYTDKQLSFYTIKIGGAK